ETDMPLHTTDIQDVDHFETAATILAARPLLQAAPALPSEILQIATDNGAFEPLEGAAKGALCARINAASAYPFRDVSEEGAQ
ncbi:MAG: hypothetical protein Q4P24_15625, partial [Rhodobacterales bacterium]|nr:hypothetical protein [Rhodobacterales bacterium]